jgi:hypothetical protein
MKNCQLTTEQAGEIIYNSVKIARNVIGSFGLKFKIQKKRNLFIY